MYTVLTVLHIIVCAFLILVVLLQAGKGGGMGIAFGGSGSQTVFGSSGAGNFLTRLTAICAVIFFANSLVLAYMSSQSDSRRLQQVAQRKAAEKEAQKSSGAKLAAELEKARQAIEKSLGDAGAAASGDAGAPAPDASGGAGAGSGAKPSKKARRQTTAAPQAPAQPSGEAPPAPAGPPPAAPGAPPAQPPPAP